MGNVRKLNGFNPLTAHSILFDTANLYGLVYFRSKLQWLLHFPPDTKTMHYDRRVCLCVWYGSHNKQQGIALTLTSWSL
jgi:hypothetical protein